MKKSKCGVLTEEDKQYIRDNHKRTTREKVRAHVRVGWNVLDGFMASEGLSWVRSGGNPLPNNHPWYKQNAQLENYVIERKHRPKLRTA